MNKVEEWKAEKHGFDVWPDMLQYAAAGTPMKNIDNADLERMKWHGVFYRKRDGQGTYMLRIRITGCEMTAAQAREIAFIAYEFGYGIIDVTTRGNIQVQGLDIKHVPTAVKRLIDVGLDSRQTGHDNIRNVFCHPLSGVDPQELIDVRPLCNDIAKIFLGDRVYSNLPRKMNIAMCGREEHGLHFWSQDISFLACRGADDRVAFQTLIGGTQGQNPHLPWHLPVLVSPEQVVPVTRAILDLFLERGSREKRDRARLRYLIEEIGVSGVLDYLVKHLDFPLEPCVHEPTPPIGYDDLIGWFPQTQRGLWAMGLCIPLGRMSWQQLEALAVLSKKWGDGTIRTTCEQGLMVPNIRTGFKDAAATDAAGCGLSLYADTLDRNTVACTGKQFCNIAVTDTKGHMFKLIEKLRQRAVPLQGIRIHMSGCPSSCAQHFTADIGLKGVRVRRLLGTREGFDVYLGGGIAGQVHLAKPHCYGVDIDQLPQLIEELVREYYGKHKPGQTFSMFWRERIADREAADVAEGAYTPPTWLCEGCGHKHLGEDPPVFCPSCAGLRRHFARLADGRDAAHEDDGPAAGAGVAAAVAPPRADGFSFACEESAVPSNGGVAVTVGGEEIALFRAEGKVVAIANACPHEGAPLAEGTIENGVVSCPWHSWTFNACTGCALSHPGNDVRRFEAKVEDGKVFLLAGGAASAAPMANKVPVAVSTPPALDIAAMLAAARGSDSKSEDGRGRPSNAAGPAKKPAKAVTAALPLLDILDETPDTKTFRLDNSAAAIPLHLPGQFAAVQVRIDGADLNRSFTISSSPTTPDRIDLTIKRNPLGTVSGHMFDQLSIGDSLKITAPRGGFFFDAAAHCEPLVLISAGSGVTPMMSILRFLIDQRLDLPCTFLYGCRTLADVIFHDELRDLASANANLRLHITLSQPPATWDGPTGRLDFPRIQDLCTPLPANRYFLCGPGGFMADLKSALRSAGVDPKRIHTEEFSSGTPAAPRPAAVLA